MKSAAERTLDESVFDDAPDEFLAPKDVLRHPVELRAGLQMPALADAQYQSSFLVHP